jgi:hypothetical protein
MSVDNYTFTPLTLDAIHQVYGADAPTPYSMRGWVARRGGAPQAIIAVLLTKKSVPTLCLRIVEHCDASSLDIIRCGRYVMRLLARDFPRVNAIADPAIPNSGKFLSKLGFTRSMLTDEGEVYEWRTR